MSLRRGLLLLVVLLLALLGWQWQRYQRFADTPLAGIGADASLVVARGDSLPAILRTLRAQGVAVGPPLYWQLLARQTGAAGRLQAGEYALPPGTTPRALLSAMRDGKVLRRMFTIVEGWNIRDLRAALAKVPLLRHEAAGMDDAALMAALGHPGQHPEGRFLPETYAWVRGDSDLDLLRRAYAAMDKALAAAWQARAPGLPLRSADEALVLASIVEKETGVADERPRIAGVFVRRLQAGMRLQTDPTVIYGLGERYTGNLRRVDLVTDTPYNTYTREGLPPTPIAMPGKAALQAATHPADGDALYFVAVGDGSGRHVFSRSLDEHNAAVGAYLQRLRAQRQAAAPGTAPR
ncbi:endolytic transglycosylase MltG [Thermomonas flagellata]|uniref:endolytic transglycosylase MltG n=1 Tax=Thermomonas flagellata TaxID=2888524 RepID=UPI001F041494|nr:endolytic transglycosylase MltG [Thermomonas flagellata]